LFIEGYGFGQGYKPPSISNKWLWTKVKIRQFEDCPACTPAGDDPAGGGPTWWKYLHTPPREIYLHDAINLCPDGCWSKVGTEAVASDKKYDIVLGSSSIPIVTGIFNGIHRVGKLNGPNGSWNFLGGAANNDILCVGTVTSQEETNEFDLYVGGKFTNINGISANTIAKWNGTSWSSLGFGLSGSGAGIVPTVNSIVKTQNFSAIYATGIFTTANNAITVNNIAKWSGSTWSALGSGLTISGDATNAVGRTIIEDFDGNIIVGGSFNRAGSTNANNIAKWNGSTWSQLGSGLNGPVFGMTLLLDGNLIVVGSFTTAGGIPAKNIAKWNGSTWSALGSGLGTVNDVKNVTVIDRFAQEKIMVVGSFTTAGGVVSNGVAIWDGSSWSTINSGQNLSAGSSINKVLRYDDIGGDNVVKVYIVGDFNSLGSTSTPGGISKFGTTASEIDWQYYPFVFGSINPDGTTTLNTGGAADNSISVYAPTSDSSQYDQGGNTSRFMQVYVSNFNTNLRKWEPFELKAGLYDISIETWWYRPCGGTGQPPCPGVPGQQEVLAGQIFWKIKLDEQIFTRRYETLKQYTCTKTQTCGGPSGRGCSLVDASIYNNDNPTATYHFEEYKCEDFGPEGCGCGPSTDDVEDTDTVNREPPTISTVTPNEISTNGGSELTIQGTNFSTLESSKGVSLTTVWIGKEPLWYPATQETVSSTSLMTAIAPAIPDPGLKDLKVTTPFGTAIKTDAILYTLAAPIITSVKLKCCPQLPTEGSLEGGTRIIIKGFNFTTAPIPPATEPRASIVKIGNNLARQVVILNDKIIEATTPPASCNTCDGFVNVTVETPTGTAVCDNCFKYNTIPQSGCILDNIWTFGKYLKAFGLPDTVTEFGPDLKAFAMGIPTAPVSTGMPASSLVFVPIDPVCYANPSVRSIRLRNWWDVLGGGVGADPGGVLPTLKSRLLLRYGVNIDIPPSDSLGNFICNPGTQPNAPNGGACRNAPNNQICCPSTFLLTPEKCNFIEDSGGFNEGDKFIDIENSVVYTHNGNNWPTNGTRTSGG
jgi:hypothetical protein